MDPKLVERLISSQTVFTGRLISVRVDEVELPGGHRARREVVIHPGAAAIVPLLPDGRVIMIRQYRHAAGKVFYELPAGTLAPGESALNCARRELAEETGYQAEHVRLLFSTYLSPGYSSEIIHVFLASGLHQTTQGALAEDEHLELVVLPLTEAVAMVGRGEVQNAAAICGLLGANAWGGPAAEVIE